MAQLATPSLADLSLPEPILAHFLETLPAMLASAGAPGASVAISVEAGPVGTCTFGLADRESQLPMTADTVFHVSSIAKPVSATVIMHLRDRGVLDIDTPIRAYLRRKDYADWRSRRRAGRVTLRQLLCHTAGVAAGTYGDLGIAPDRNPSPTTSEVLSGCCGPGTELRFDAEPGGEAAYCSAGYVLAQLVAEDITGTPFPRLAQETVFGPLGLHATIMGPAPGVRLATGYNQRGAPRALGYYPSASSDLRSTPSNLAAFFGAFLPGPHGEQPGRAVVRPDTAREMISPQGRSPDRPPWGLGFRLRKTPTGWNFRHGGWSTGHWSIVQASPVPHVVLALSINSDTGRGWGLQFAKDAWTLIRRHLPG